MRRMCALLAATLLVACISETGGARILGLFYFPGKSHFVMFEALMKGLAAKGHDVTVVSPFPQKHKVANYTDLSLEGAIPSFVNQFTVELVRNFEFVNLLDVIWTQNLELCRNSLRHPLMQDLLKTKDSYDLIVTEIFGVDCCIGYTEKFNVPVIAMISSVSLPWANHRVGNPDNPSYIPNYFLSYKPEMGFMERLVNSVFYVLTQLGYYFYSEIPTDNILRQNFGDDVPPLSELVKRTNLVFVNSHFSVNQPRPNVPAFVEVGGLHISPPKKLPEDLQRFLDGSSKGVIYFSFGSIVRGETFPKDKLNALIETFRKLPQNIVWKMNSSVVPNLPPNIKASTWLPQNEILSHPNVRLFISHGGLMGSQEAVYHGVPVLGIPLFADQKQNIERLVHTGMALHLEYDQINEERLTKSLKTLLEDPSYREKAQHLSRLFRDRPQSALDTAIYWTEYVIRHGGAAHLRSAAADMPLYQYLLLDVISVLVLGVCVTLVTMWCVVSKLLSLVLAGIAARGRHEDKKKK